jgi:hypothetical protein
MKKRYSSGQFFVSVFALVIALALAVISALTLTSCTKKPQLDEQTLEALENIDQAASAHKNVVFPDGSTVDYDLTGMNPNMIYAQVFNLMLSPEEYEGKTFRMKGNFLRVNDIDGKPSCAVVIKDALACCQQGLEFKYDFGSSLPSDGDEILVTGTFVMLTRDDGISYTYIKADSAERL